MKRNYKQLFKHGNKAQKEKLLKNTHKSGFNDLSIKYAIRRLKEEIKELEYEVNRLVYYKTDNFTQLKNIRHEAADVANFAHMLILRCDNLIGKKPTD